MKTDAATLKAGDDIVYVANPDLYGVGILVQIHKDGQHEVLFDDGASEKFSRPEIRTRAEHLAALDATKAKAKPAPA
jgi:hypothetical protein